GLSARGFRSLRPFLSGSVQAVACDHTQFAAAERRLAHRSAGRLARKRGHSAFRGRDARPPKSTATKSGMSPFPPRLRGASAVGDNPASFSLHVAAQTGFSYKARGVVVLSRSECVDGTEQSPRSRLGAAAAPPARERDPDARDGR